MNIPDSFQTDALLIISSFFLIFLSFFFLFCLGSMLSLISDLPELTVWHAMLNVVEVRSEECQHKASKIVKTQYSGHTNSTVFVVYRKKLWYFRLYILHRHKYLLLYLFHNITAECYFVDRFTVTDAIHVNCCYCLPLLLSRTLLSYMFVTLMCSYIVRIQDEDSSCKKEQLHGCCVDCWQCAIYTLPRLLTAEKRAMTSTPHSQIPLSY